MVRVSLILAAVMVCAAVGAAQAKDTKVIDKRVRSEEMEYAISLAAEDGELGHSFIIWNTGDAALRQTIQQAVGFYPASEKSQLKTLFGLSTGYLADDAHEKPDYVLIVQVNSDAYAKAQVVYDKWRETGNYLLGFNDCTTFVAEIGAALGLNMPTRIWAPYPLQYVKAVAEMN
jgi:hypothetical protein